MSTIAVFLDWINTTLVDQKAYCFEILSLFGFDVILFLYLYPNIHNKNHNSHRYEYSSFVLHFKKSKWVTFATIRQKHLRYICLFFLNSPKTFERKFGFLEILEPERPMKVFWFISGWEMKAQRSELLCPLLQTQDEDPGVWTDTMGFLSYKVLPIHCIKILANIKDLR